LTTLTTTISLGLALVACSALQAADYQRLDVKIGQWETTLSGQSTGIPPMPEEMLKRLTPEQRAKIEQAIQARNGSGSKTVNKSCLTKDELDKPFSVDNDATKACSRTLITSSGSTQEIHIDCSSNGMKSSGTVKVEAVDSEHIKGSMHMTASDNEHTMNMNYTFASRWVGPTCAK